MNKRHLSFLGLFCMVQLTIPGARPLIVECQTLIRFDITFPENIKQIPLFPIYYKGKKICGKKEKYSNALTFFISEKRDQTGFYILIYNPQSELPRLCTIECGSIKHLKIEKNVKYKLYRVYLIKKEISDKKRPFYIWKIKEEKLSVSNIIPKNTIIVPLDSHFIDLLLDGGDAISFPTLKIKEDIISEIGEEAFYTFFEELAILLINFNAIHATPIKKEKICCDDNNKKNTKKIIITRP